VERYPYSRWVRTRQEDKAWSTLGTLASRGVFLSVPSANVKVLENGKRRPMTPQEQHNYQKRVGAGYRKFVEDNSEKLLRMKPDEAAKFIKDETERIRRRND
jgi:thymidylate kinase